MARAARPPSPPFPLPPARSLTCVKPRAGRQVLPRIPVAMLPSPPYATREKRQMPAKKRWTRRPEGSTWGDYGPDDQLGRMNELTPEKVKQGIAEVKEGRTFCLSMPLDYPGGNVLNPRRY